MPSRRALARLAAVGALWLLASGCTYFYANRYRYHRAYEPRRGVYHTVQRGQTLWRIARTYGVDMEQVAVLNGIDDPDVIRAGARIFVPGVSHIRRVPLTGGPPPPKERPVWAVPKVEGGAHLRRASAGGIKPRFVWPVKGRLIERFGNREGVKYDGIAIAAPEDRPVRAAADGQVIFSDWGPGGYGRTIIIRHAGGQYHSVYAHNAENLVRKGQIVRRGAPIALVGRTGHVETAQLHFEIRYRTIPRDPLSYLP